MCEAVIDLQLQEQREQNRIMSEQMKLLLTKQEAMEKQVCDLQLHSEIKEREAAVPKTTNCELQGTTTSKQDYNTGSGLTKSI
jgi:hypothetical protein